MRFVLVALVLAGAVGGLALAVAHPSAPREPWGRRLLRLVPLAAVAGAVLALWSGNG
jgi:peptidoglycan/LPS O-acetylase OafA/YrhL